MGKEEEVLKSIYIFSNPFMKFRVDTIRSKGGEIFDRGITERGKGVGILALTDKLDIILAKQYESGPKEHIFKIPGGALEGNESFEVAAQRELFQEVGYEAKRFDFLYEYPGDAATEQQNKYFLATSLYIPQKPAEVDPRETQIIKHFVPLEQALKVVLRNPKVSSATFRMVFMTYDKILSDPSYTHFKDKLTSDTESIKALQYLFNRPDNISS